MRELVQYPHIGELYISRDSSQIHFRTMDPRAPGYNVICQCYNEGDSIYDVTDTVLYLNGIPDGIYLASIRTKCTRNMYWSLWSDSTSITVDNTLSVAATPAPNVTLSPNPTGGTLTIRCAAEMTKVELYDMQGRLALSATPTGSETMLDLQPLPTGSYVAIITTSQGTTTRKVERQ